MPRIFVFKSSEITSGYANTPTPIIINGRLKLINFVILKRDVTKRDVMWVAHRLIGVWSMVDTKGSLPKPVVDKMAGDWSGGECDSR